MGAGAAAGRRSFGCRRGGLGRQATAATVGDVARAAAHPAGRDNAGVDSVAAGCRAGRGGSGSRRAAIAGKTGAGDVAARPTGGDGAEHVDDMGTGQGYSG
jgi:hypothetical protein